MTRQDKVRENRLRRMAARQGLALHRSRVRDRSAVDYGRYWLVDEDGDVVLGVASLNDIEVFLGSGEDGMRSDDGITQPVPGGRPVDVDLGLVYERNRLRAELEQLRAENAQLHQTLVGIQVMGRAAYQSCESRPETCAVTHSFTLGAVLRAVDEALGVPFGGG